MRLVVIGKPLEYDGKRFPVGAEVECTGQDGRLFIALHYAELPKQKEHPNIPPLGLARGNAVQVKARADEDERRYNRRDMRAKE